MRVQDSSKFVITQKKKFHIWKLAVQSALSEANITPQGRNREKKTSLWKANTYYLL